MAAKSEFFMMTELSEVREVKELPPISGTEVVTGWASIISAGICGYWKAKGIQFENELAKQFMQYGPIAVQGILGAAGGLLYHSSSNGKLMRFLRRQLMADGIEYLVRNDAEKKPSKPGTILHGASYGAMKGCVEVGLGYIAGYGIGFLFR